MEPRGTRSDAYRKHLTRRLRAMQIPHPELWQIILPPYRAYVISHFQPLDQSMRRDTSNRRHNVLSVTYPTARHFVPVDILKVSNAFIVWRSLSRQSLLFANFCSTSSINLFFDSNLMEGVKITCRTFIDIFVFNV